LIETEDGYGYSGREGSCNYNPKLGQFQISGFVDVTPFSPSQLMAAVAIGPVSVALEAESTFQLYSSGILSADGCGTIMDHGVLVVGYGTDAGQDYWLVKNSWGTNWGEKGYIRLARDNIEGSAGTCGL